jgi:CRISPR-associated protein Cmr3
MNGSTHRLALVPRDGFFVKDGRGWQTSARTSVLDWPWPTTVRGALTTVSGKVEERERGSRFGPQQWKEHQSEITVGSLIALRRLLPDGAWSRMWPVPADALWIEERTSVLRLKPRSPATSTLGRTAPKDAPQGYAEAREALWVAQNVRIEAKPLGRPRWWDETTLIKWLSAEDVEAKPKEQYPRMASRFQVHVGIRPDALTGDDGILFAHDVVETLERSAPRNGDGGAGTVAEWAIGAEVTWLLGAVPKDRVARLGSDSRIAWIEEVSGDLFKMPDQVRGALSKPSQGLRLMLVTPACFKGGWLPDGFAPVRDDTGEWVFRGRLPRPGGAPHAAIYDRDLILRAACVPRPMHISGWDMASDKGTGGAPRSTSRLVPPGAVYFFERADGQPFAADDAQKLWLAPLGTHDDEGFGRTSSGFGRVVPGIWNPKDAA